jgi:N-acetylmuramoyl-L-alanine amidase
MVYPEGEGSSETETGILKEEGKAPSTKDEEVRSSDDTEIKSKNRLIAIDAGHQSTGNNEKEPIGPGASTTKPKVSSGTRGVATGVPEYKLNLVIALKVQKELLSRGYDVYMIRDTNDVNLSNKERAEMANESGADLFIRIHADGSENSSVSGTSTLYPSEDNPYVASLYEDSYALSKAIVDSMCDQTGARNRGAIARDDMSGINWCTIPVSIIEMGYMSNKKEDKLMQTEEYQDKMVEGICDGIDAYYE